MTRLRTSAAAREADVDFSRPSRLRRLHDLLFLARSAEGWTAGRLARKFHVSRRRIFEDVQVLGSWGYRLFFDGKGYRLSTPDLQLPVTLRVDEILALLRPQGGHREARDVAQLKLAEALPAPLKQLFRNPRTVRASPVSTPLPASIWAAVDEALADRRLLRLRYRGNRDLQGQERLVEPQALFLNGTGWYLAAWCRKAGAVRLFRMDRIAGASLEEARYELRAGFDVEQYVASDLGVWVGKALDAEVEILPTHVEAVRSEALARGLPFRRTASGGVLGIPRGHLDEAAWWLARFGEGARVVRPPELRARLASLGRRMAELNGG